MKADHLAALVKLAVAVVVMVGIARGLSRSFAAAAQPVNTALHTR